MERAELARGLRAAAYLEGDFVLRSGRRSPFYLDKYRFETQPELLGPLGREIAAAVEARPEPVDLLAGPELGAVALAAAASLASGLPFLIVRKASKGYGTDRLLEGVYQPGRHVVLVEDVVTTGGAAIAAVEAIRAAGLSCTAAVCVVDREEGGTEAMAAAGIALVPLFRLAEIQAAAG